MFFQCELAKPKLVSQGDKFGGTSYGVLAGEVLANPVKHLVSFLTENCRQDDIPQGTVNQSLWTIDQFVI